jgi:hypothetical protein
MDWHSVKNSFVHINGPSGHRAEYQSLFTTHFDLEPSLGRISGAVRKRLIKADRLLFATIDDDLFGYLWVSVLRAVSGRRTVGIYLRPQSCLARGAKAFVKRVLLGFLRRLRGVTTLSSIPFDLLEGQEKFVSGWLHDPQLWDLWEMPDLANPAMEENIKSLATGRPVLAFLGHISTLKGFPVLTAMVAARPDLARQYLIIVAGTLENDCRNEVDQLVRLGVKVWPRRIEDSEMAEIYKNAALIWACYAPSYDQASGIFGRAIQRQRMVVLREGALISRYADVLDHPYLALPDDAAVAADRLAGAKVLAVPKHSVLAEWRAQSLAAIENKL